MVGGLKFENKPLTIRWYLFATRYTTPENTYFLKRPSYVGMCDETVRRVNKWSTRGKTKKQNRTISEWKNFPPEIGTLFLSFVN